MRHRASTTKLWIGLCAIMLAAVCASLVSAQTQTNPQQQTLFQIYLVQAKPGMGSEFEGVIKNDLIPAMKKITGSALFTFRTEFGQVDSYLLASPLKSLAELDAPDPLVKELGDKGLAYLLVRMNQLTYSPRVFLIIGRPDLGVPAPQGYMPKLAVLSTVSIAQGRANEFEASGKILRDIQPKTNVKGVLVAKVVLGGDANEYISFSLFDTFGDIEKYAQTVGKLTTEAKMPSPAGIILHRETAVMRFVPEMSFVPPAQPATKK